jgi:hypothetical protein
LINHFPSFLSHIPFELYSISALLPRLLATF